MWTTSDKKTMASATTSGRTGQCQTYDVNFGNRWFHESYAFLKRDWVRSHWVCMVIYLYLIDDIEGVMFSAGSTSSFNYDQGGHTRVTSLGKSH